MIRSLAALTIAATALLSGSATAEPAGNLKTLCDRICGGTWTEQKGIGGPVPDEMTSAYAYRWDEQLQAIRGTRHITGGVRFVNTISDIVIGQDPVTGALWQLAFHGSYRPAYAEVTLTATGYNTNGVRLGDPDAGTQSETHVFDGANAQAYTCSFQRAEKISVCATVVFKR